MADLGLDLSGIADMSRTVESVEGRVALMQALVRRLITPHGTLFYDEDYGYDLRQFLNASTIPAPEIAQQIELEMLKDERVEEANARVVRVGSDLRIAISIEDSTGTFDLVANVSAMSVALLRQ